MTNIYITLEKQREQIMKQVGELHAALDEANENINLINLQMSEARDTLRSRLNQLENLVDIAKADLLSVNYPPHLDTIRKSLADIKAAADAAVLIWSEDQ